MAHCEEYIARLIEKDEEAFAHIYDETKHAVYAMIVSIVRDKATAEDLMQDTYMTMIEKIHQFEQGRNFISWLLTIARNKAIDYYRNHQKVLIVEPETIDYVGSSVDPKGEQEAMVHEMLSQLSEVERQIFLLHIMSNITFRQIATIMRIPIGTILWHYSRATQKIRRYKEDI